MATNSQSTFVMVKPNAVVAKHTGDIISRFEGSGLTLRRLKGMRLSEEFAGEFYAEHIGKPFYAGLVGFMTSGPVVAMELEGENAIQKVRDLIGHTNPAMAAVGTIRELYGNKENMTENAVHASANPDDAARELGLIFAPSDAVIS
jgi:nucleoside-diphosphate kinase